MRVPASASQWRVHPDKEHAGGDRPLLGEAEGGSTGHSAGAGLEKLGTEGTGGTRNFVRVNQKCMTETEN